MRADFAVQCEWYDSVRESYHSTPEYDSVRALAVVGILLYPVGVSLLYAVLFHKARRAILDEKPTALSRALGFLTLDFEKTFFWWELVEAWKKCMVAFFESCGH